MLDVALIASAAVQVLAPILRRLLSAGAEKATEAANEGVAETLWEKVKGKIFGKKGAVDAASEVAAAPGAKDAQKMLWIHLEQILAADPDLAAEGARRDRVLQLAVTRKRWGLYRRRECTVRTVPAYANPNSSSDRAVSSRSANEPSSSGERIASTRATVCPLREGKRLRSRRRRTSRMPFSFPRSR